MSSLSTLFRRPLLIYDDKCYSCTKFARIASRLSRGWIRIAGHYYSLEAKEAKSIIFPPGYDPSGMFWLVNASGAFGARSGLPRVIKEIAFGIFTGEKTKVQTPPADVCEYGEQMTCSAPNNVIRRVARLLSHGATFRF
jgi:hypothetical protein